MEKETMMAAEKVQALADKGMELCGKDESKDLTYSQLSYLKELLESSSRGWYEALTTAFYLGAGSAIKQ